MRITLQQYERAKQAVAKLSRHQATVEAWETAERSVGSTGNMKIVAIKIVDGKVTAECESIESAVTQQTPSSTKSTL